MFMKDSDLTSRMPEQIGWSNPRFSTFILLSFTSILPTWFFRNSRSHSHTVQHHVSRTVNLHLHLHAKFRYQLLMLSFQKESISLQTQLKPKNIIKKLVHQDLLDNHTRFHIARSD